MRRSVGLWRRRQAGFSLVEMIVVVAIISLLAFIALPRLSGIADGIRTKNAAYQVAADIRLAQELAQKEGTTTRVFFWPDGAYEVQKGDPLAPSVCPTTAVYTLNVTRGLRSSNADLGSLALSAGTLQFSSAQLSYTVNVPNATASVVLTATVADSNASLTVNGTTQNNGSPRSVALAPGPNTILVKVVAEDRTTSKTYTVTVNRAPGADLSQLSFDKGSLSPVFAPGTGSYTLNASNSTSSVSLIASANDAAAAITVNGQSKVSGSTWQIALGSPGSTTTVNVGVAANDGTSRSYTVTIVRASSKASNANLAGLAVMPGQLDPGFDANTLSYNVELPASATSVSLTATWASQDQTMKIGSSTVTSGVPFPITLTAEDTVVRLVVTAENRVTTKTYKVDFHRNPYPSSNASLSSITVNPGALDTTFQSDTFDYNVNVTRQTTQLSLTAVLGDPYASMTVNGSQVASGTTQTVTLGGPGSSTPITVVVTAEDGTTTSTYTVTVHRSSTGSNDATLQALVVDPGTMTQTGTGQYSVSVHNTTTQVTVTATVHDPGASLTINGVAATSGAGTTIPMDPTGSATNVTVTVLAEDGTTTLTNTITVTPAAPNITAAGLASLTVDGALVSGFNPALTNYAMLVPSLTTQIQVAAVGTDRTQRLRINGGQIVNGTASQTIKLGNGTTRITVEVSSSLGSYQVWQTRPGDLKTAPEATFTNMTLSCLSFEQTGRAIWTMPQVPTTLVTPDGGQNSSTVPGRGTDVFSNLVNGKTLPDWSTLSGASDAVTWTPRPGTPVDAANPVQVYVDLGLDRRLDSVCAGVLQRLDEGVAFPTRVALSWWDPDQNMFVSNASLIKTPHQSSQKNDRDCTSMALSAAANKPVRYLKFTVTPSGNSLAVDEIELPGAQITVQSRNGKYSYTISVAPVTGRVTIQ